MRTMIGFREYAGIIKMRSRFSQENIVYIHLQNRYYLHMSNFNIHVQQVVHDMRGVQRFYIIL